MPLTPSTLGTQLTRVRLLLQEPTTQYWTDATLNAYINEAQVEIAVGVVPGIPMGMSEPLIAREATTPSVASQESYGLPTNYHAARTVRTRSTSTENYSEAPVVDIEYVRAHPRSAAPKAEAYFLWGAAGTYQLGMYPAFDSANGTIYLSYWGEPDLLVSGSDNLMIPLETHTACTYLAAHKAWLERSHATEADKALQAFVTSYTGALQYIRARQINLKRAVMPGVIGDTDTERTLY